MYKKYIQTHKIETFDFGSELRFRFQPVNRVARKIKNIRKIKVQINAKI